jgi:uncharacterized membrane protein
VDGFHHGRSHWQAAHILPSSCCQPAVIRLAFATGRPAGRSACWTTAMTALGPFSLALAAAVLHAGWNLALARGSRQQDRAAFTAPVLASVLVLTPPALAGWRVDLGVLPWVAGSATAELGYFAALDRLYRAVPVERGYPVSRGTAPVIVLLASLALGGGPALLPALGVLTLCAGVLLSSRGDGVSGPAGAVGLLRLTLPVSVGIAVYTVLDSHGIDHAGAASYLWLTMGPVALLITADTVRREGPTTTVAQLRTARCWLAGIGITGAYLLILLALGRATPNQVPVVAGLRETSVVLVPLLGWLASGRRPAGSVLAGSTLILVALLLIRVGG